MTTYVDHVVDIDESGIAHCSCRWSYDPFVRSDVQYTQEVADRHVAKFRRACWCGGEDGEHEADAHAEEGRW